MTRAHHTILALVRPPAGDVDAGMPVTFALRVTCSAGCSLPDATIEIIDRAGDEVATSRTDGVAGEAIELVAMAPAEVGEVVWTARCPRHERVGRVHEASEIAIRFRTLAHRTSMAVWDVRSPVAAGETLSAAVGVRCAAGCNLNGSEIRVVDAAGIRVGCGVLGSTPLAGTEALYWTEVPLSAPPAEGLTERRALLATESMPVPHEPVSAAFTFMTTRSADHMMTVHVVDRATQAGLADVEVRVGPYTLTTDASGTARAPLPRGRYGVSIRRDGFTVDPIMVDVAGDLLVRLEAVKAPTMAERAETLNSFEGYPWG